MAYCFDETEVDGETVQCVRTPGHDGQHAGYVPQDDEPGLMWPLHEWGDDDLEEALKDERDRLEAAMDAHEGR